MGTPGKPYGRVAYLLRKPRRNGATHLVMTPVQFLARIASLIPPPRFPLQRFSGVLAPNSPWRPAVVAMRPSAPTLSSAAEPRPAPPRAKKKKAKGKKDPQDSTSDVVFLPSANGASSAPVPVASVGTRTSLGAGLVLTCPGRLDWASLLRRVFLHDVLACPCGGRRRIVADINEPHAIEDILGHLGLPFQAPPVARARDPSEHAD